MMSDLDPSIGPEEDEPTIDAEVGAQLLAELLEIARWFKQGFSK